MVFGKTYHFKVKSYVKDAPRNKSDIKWLLKYHCLFENKWKEILLPAKGDNVEITMDNEDLCGRFVFVRAYIKDHETEANLQVWKHNRFRWFDRKIVYDEIKERTDNNKPYLIDQAGTSLCGMACIFYLFAKDQPEDFKKFAKELFRTGKAKFNNYSVEPSFEILERKADVLKTKTGLKFVVKGTGGMPLTDYIVMAATRNSDNKDYKGGDEEFQAINWPPLMTELSEKLLGYKDVVSAGIYNPIKKPTNYPVNVTFKIIKDINEQLQKGYRVILMIDSDLIQDDPDFYFPKKISIKELKKSAQSPFEFDYHWIVLESLIKENPWLNKEGSTEYKLDFKVYTWGGNTEYLKQQITLKHFINNFYGYIKVK